MKDKGVFRPGAGARGALARQGCAPGPGGQAGGRGDRMPGGRGAGRAGRPAAAHPRPGAAAVAAPGTPCGWRRSIRCRVPREGRKPIPIAIWVGQRPGASARGCLDVWLAGGGCQRAGARQTGGRDDRIAPAGRDGIAHHAWQVRWRKASKTWVSGFCPVGFMATLHRRRTDEAEPWRAGCPRSEATGVTRRSVLGEGTMPHRQKRSIRQRNI